MQRNPELYPDPRTSAGWWGITSVPGKSPLEWGYGSGALEIGLVPKCKMHDYFKEFVQKCLVNDFLY